MNEFFGSIWWLIVSLGVLVTFHEFGHYWVARRCGVRVLRFSVGFGTPLWRRTNREGTEFVIAALPLGGYVKMLDEREGDVPAELLPEAFTRKSVWQRFAIVAAGPGFNLILAVALLWLMFMIGKGDYLPIVGRSSDIAQQAGLQQDDRILSIGGQQVETWTHVGMALGTAVMDRRVVPVEVTDPSGRARTLQLDLSGIPTDLTETQAMQRIGLVPRQLLIPAHVGEVVADSPAARGGMQPGDLILRIDGRRVEFFDDISSILSDYEPSRGAVVVEVKRADRFLELQIEPERRQLDDGSTRWLLGIQAARADATHDAVLRYGPIDAIGAAFKETWRLTTATLGMLWRMVSGIASLQNISGPITIAQYANASAQMGAAWFCFFLAVLSLSLCIMNLLPIPILDGGHLLYYLIEMIKGSPVSERMLLAGQYVGLAFLVGLMGLAFYNDIMRLVG